MNTIEEIPLTILDQVVQGIIFTMLGLKAEPLKVELAPACLIDADGKTRTYADSILSAMESGKPLPVPAAPWQMHTHAVLECLMKERIEQFLRQDGVVVDDRVGRIIKSYLRDTSLDGTFHDYLRHGSLRPSKFGYAWVAKLAHQLMPKLQGVRLNQTGCLWLSGFNRQKASAAVDRRDSGDTLSM